MVGRSEEHTSELQSRQYIVCRLLFVKDTATTEIYALSLLDALPICASSQYGAPRRVQSACAGVLDMKLGRCFPSVFASLRWSFVRTARPAARRAPGRRACGENGRQIGRAHV